MVGVILALLQKTDVGAPNNYGFTPLHMMMAADPVMLDFGANVHARRHAVPEGPTRRTLRRDCRAATTERWIDRRKGQPLGYTFKIPMHLVLRMETVVALLGLAPILESLTVRMG